MAISLSFHLCPESLFSEITAGQRTAAYARWPWSEKVGVKQSTRQTKFDMFTQYHPVPQDVQGNQIERVASRDSFCCSGDKFGLLAESNTNP